MSRWTGEWMIDLLTKPWDITASAGQQLAETPRETARMLAVDKTLEHTFMEQGMPETVSMASISPFGYSQLGGERSCLMALQLARARDSDCSFSFCLKFTQ